MKLENMVLAIMACFLIFISMSCICACDDADVANTIDAEGIIVDDAIDDGINVIDDGGSSADDGINVIVDGGSSADDGIDVVVDGGSSADDGIDVVVDGGSSADDSVDVVVDGDSIINDVPKYVPKYNSEPISNVKASQGTFGDLQYLINSLPAGSVLFLDNDYAMQDKDSSVSILKDITINGNGHTINANGKGTIFKIKGGNILLEGIIFTNGKAPDNGGAVNISSAISVCFTKCSFENNKADKMAGAVYSKASVIFTSCNFKSNLANQQGGAIYSEDVVSCENCTFADGKAGGYGGAICSQRDLSVVNSIFKSNGGKKGGAIYANGLAVVNSSLFDNNYVSDIGNNAFGGAIYSCSLLNVDSCKFYNSTAGDRGAGIYAEDDLKITGKNEFIENEANDFGGAIYSKGCVYINFYDNCKTTFKLNYANSDNGGAIYCEKNVYVKNSDFRSNLAEDNGAGIYSKGDVYVNQESDGKSLFIFNYAYARGGAIYCEKNVYVENSDFDRNWAHDFGGAIYSKGDVYVNWNGNGVSTFESNNASSDNGGAIYSENKVYVRNSDFDSNFAEDNGGAIFSKGDAYINWNVNGVSSFNSNRANTDEGGAIYSKANVYVKNSDFSYGYAHDGGAIYAEGNTIIDSSSFSNNCASHQGGAIYEKAGIALHGYTYFTDNMAKDSGGAIYTRKFDEDVWHATFRNNQAGDDGGAIYIDHENHETFTECDFEKNVAGDEGGAIYLDDGDSHLSLIRNNLVNNKAKSGYTVYNHGNYDDIKDNWHGSASPNFDNQFKKYRLILKDKVITPSSYATSRIVW